MAKTSQLPAAIDALVEDFQAAPGLTAPGGAGVPVYDGPVVTDDAAMEVVWVGFDGDPAGGFQAADTTSQTWAGIGAKSKDETFGVVCSVVAARGDTDVKAARDRAYVILGVIEDVLRANPSMGFPPPTVFSLVEVSPFQEQTTSGIQCRLAMTIQVRTRI